MFVSRKKTMFYSVIYDFLRLDLLVSVEPAKKNRNFLTHHERGAGRILKIRVPSYGQTGNFPVEKCDANSWPPLWFGGAWSS